MNKLYNSILELCLYQEIENSKNFLDILYLEVKICRVQIDFLENEKPFWFQKKKLKKYQQEKHLLEKRIDKYQQSIATELNYIAKMYDN